MAYKFNDLKGFLFLMLFTIPKTTSTNIDCCGKSFHCVNSTHFMICVDLGCGNTTTVDDLVMRCPPTTACHESNQFECEFPKIEVTTPALNLVDATNDFNVLSPIIDSVTTKTHTEVITVAPSTDKNTVTVLPVFKEITIYPMKVIKLADLKEEFTDANNKLFDQSLIVSTSTVSPMKSELAELNLQPSTEIPSDKVTEVNSTVLDTTTSTNYNITMNKTNNQFVAPENIFDETALNVVITTQTPNINAKPKIYLDKPPDDVLSSNQTNNNINLFKHKYTTPNSVLDPTQVSVAKMNTTSNTAYITTHYIESATTKLILDANSVLNTEAPSMAGMPIKVRRNQLLEERSTTTAPTVHSLQTVAVTESVKFAGDLILIDTIKKEKAKPNSSSLLSTPPGKQETSYNDTSTDTSINHNNESSLLFRKDDFTSIVVLAKTLQHDKNITRRAKEELSETVFVNTTGIDINTKENLDFKINNGIDKKSNSSSSEIYQETQMLNLPTDLILENKRQITKNYTIPLENIGTNSYYMVTHNPLNISMVTIIEQGQINVTESEYVEKNIYTITDRSNKSVSNIVAAPVVDSVKIDNTSTTNIIYNAPIITSSTTQSSNNKMVDIDKIIPHTFESAANEPSKGNESETVIPTPTTTEQSNWKTTEYITNVTPATLQYENILNTPSINTTELTNHRVKVNETLTTVDYVKEKNINQDYVFTPTVITTTDISALKVLTTETAMEVTETLSLINTSTDSSAVSAMITRTNTINEKPLVIVNDSMLHQVSPSPVRRTKTEASNWQPICSIKDFFKTECRDNLLMSRKEAAIRNEEMQYILFRVPPATSILKSKTDTAGASKLNKTKVLFFENFIVDHKNEQSAAPGESLIDVVSKPKVMKKCIDTTDKKTMESSITGDMTTSRTKFSNETVYNNTSQLRNKSQDNVTKDKAVRSTPLINKEDLNLKTDNNILITIQINVNKNISDLYIKKKHDTSTENADVISQIEITSSNPLAGNKNKKVKNNVEYPLTTVSDANRSLMDIENQKSGSSKYDVSKIGNITSKGNGIKHINSTVNMSITLFNIGNEEINDSGKSGMSQTDLEETNRNVTVNNILKRHIDQSNKSYTQAHSTSEKRTYENLLQNVTTIKNKNSSTSESSTLNNNNTVFSFDCTNLTRGKYADNKDCRKFYTCSGKFQPVVGVCPNNTVFSEINKQCTRNLSHCVRNNQFHCLYEGRFSDFFKDNTYYICVKSKSQRFIRYKLQCQNGYYLNMLTVKCTKNEIISSQSASTTSENSQINNDKNVIVIKSDLGVRLENDFECKKEGTFPHLKDCRMYYVCFKNNRNKYRRIIKKCSDNKIYDKENNMCSSGESNEC